jgi:hypothetical protein
LIERQTFVAKRRHSNNETPQRFHIHTIVRTPNGNDYGMDLLRLHYETAPHHRKHSGHSHVEAEGR